MIDESTAAHDRNEFGEAGRLAYDFFWSDFADWYIEASKTRLYSRDADAAAQARRVLVYVLDRVLRLWHPFLPFVTEQAWAPLPHTEREEALMVADWPARRCPRCATATAQFAALQAVVGAIRNARSEYDVPLGKKIQVCCHCSHCP